MNIELIPAIDIIGGKCVRLTKGDYATKTVYSDSPADVAETFERMGIRRLHVVDLDGARSKHVVNLDTLKEITRRTRLTVDFGGGIKSDADIEKAFACGISGQKMIDKRVSSRYNGNYRIRAVPKEPFYAADQ